LALLGVLSAACGDDDKDEGGGASPEIAAVCATQCRRGEECNFLEPNGLTPSSCRSSCEELNGELTEDCMFTSEEAESCRAAYEDQTCDEIANATVPDQCVKTCMISAM
jgi:hypothetical protein